MLFLLLSNSLIFFGKICTPYLSLRCAIIPSQDRNRVVAAQRGGSGFMDGKHKFMITAEGSDHTLKCL
jgi:hypothetical protein